MALDIDMKNYAGAPNHSDAGNEQVVDTNFYQQERGDYVPLPELLEPQKEESRLAPVEAEVNPQAENFKAFREEIDRIKKDRETEKRELQLQIDMLRANTAPVHQPVKAEPEYQSKKIFEGMKGEDVPNVDELRKEMSQREDELHRYQQQREDAYKAQLEELQFQTTHPDYLEVLDKYTRPLFTEKPHLVDGIYSAKNKALYAYEMGKMAQQLQASKEVPKQSENAKRMVENSRKPGTLSQAGGQSALSKADYFASMSDREFMQMASKNLDAI